MPLSSRAEPKSRFVASKWEHKKVRLWALLNLLKAPADPAFAFAAPPLPQIMKIVRAIRQGRIVPNKPAVTKPQFYALWSNADQERAPHAMHMPAPQPRLPDDSESYNPAGEYLLDDDERSEWENTEKGDRKKDYMPQKHSSLRVVPAYKNLVQERFERCLDLYLAPRMRRTKLNIDPESLVPKLPSPKELRPFPTMHGLRYVHPGGVRVRCVSIDPTGMWMASGAEDGTVRVWEVANGRLAWRCEAGKGPVFSIEWCPDKEIALIAATLWVSAAPICRATHRLTRSLSLPQREQMCPHLPHSPPQRQRRPRLLDDRPQGCHRCLDEHPDRVDRRSLEPWNRLGAPPRSPRHRRRARNAQAGLVAPQGRLLLDCRDRRCQQVRPHPPAFQARHAIAVQEDQGPGPEGRFPPVQASLFRRRMCCLSPTVTRSLDSNCSPCPPPPQTQRYVKLYDLVAQTLVKTLQPGLRWLSSIDIHPMGDNLIVGSYDKKLCWFDLDLSSKPYKTLRYQTRAIRQVHYHRSYPLFASCSDDGTINIFHGTVYSDLLQNPLIVPLKVLRGHGVRNGLGVLDIKWHPTLPWLISAGADGEARLWMP